MFACNGMHHYEGIMLKVGCCCVLWMQFEWGEHWGRVGQAVDNEAVDGFLAD